MKHPTPAMLRLMDAAANRGREALRCLEDTARFILADGTAAAEFKSIRHALVAALRPLGLSDAVACRDIETDVGKDTKTSGQLELKNHAEMVDAAFGRAGEALRSLEEVARTMDIPTSMQIESLRYRLYAAARAVQMASRQVGRLPPTILCVLITEALCRRNWIETLDAVLDGGADMVQLREKDIDGGELLIRGRLLVDRCRRHNCVPIINDRFDVALACGAGVHVGQSDLPCVELRKLAPADMIIGVSTSRMEEARAAVRAGASYIGIGPMFESRTKIKPRLAGIEYARQIAAENLPIPALAISGITVDNIEPLVAAGVRSIAVSSAVISSEDPAAACRALRRALEPRASQTPSGAGNA